MYSKFIIRKSSIFHLTELSFDMVGSTFASSIDCKLSTTFPTVNLSLLRDAEGNHCSSFPVILLQLLQSGAQICPPDDSASLSNSLKTSKEEQALNLLSTAQSFDPLAWATSINSHSPVPDLFHRTQLASAHRAAVCIYLSRVLLSIDSTAQISQGLETLVKQIIDHLSPIQPGDTLFTAIAWPAFVAGAETNDLHNREWIVEMFQKLWQVEPWGLFRGALSALEGIWKRKSDAVLAGESLTRNENEGNWLRDIRESGVDWLIL